MRFDIGINYLKKKRVGNVGNPHAKLAKLAEINPRAADLAKAVNELLGVGGGCVPLDKLTTEGIFKMSPAGEEVMGLVGLGYVDPPKEGRSSKVLNDETDEVRVGEAVEGFGDSEQVQKVVDLVLVSSSVIGGVLEAAKGFSISNARGN